MARGVGVGGALFGDGLLQRLQARGQHGGVALGGLDRRFLALLDGQLRGVKLFLDLKIIVRHLVARDGFRAVRIRREQPGGEKPHRAHRKKFLETLEDHDRNRASVKRRENEVKPG